MTAARANEKRVAVVTGASSGIGLGITTTLLERGYRVVGNSRTISQSTVLQRSADLILVDGDIGTKEASIRVVDAAVHHFGRIDLLVNTAGIYLAKPFTQYAPEDFDLMIHTNVAGYFFVTQQAVTQMQSKSGHIVSIATVLVDQPRPALLSPSPSSPSPPSRRSVVRLRWSSSRMGLEQTPSPPVWWTRRCTPRMTIASW
jgi:NAD(P)-dependent dehydrogenase (short-subunit alcohol dehydrogenase family)